eukprot:4040213-Alexandrium_andersonii.AAC.1
MAARAATLGGVQARARVSSQCRRAGATPTAAPGSCARSSVPPRRRPVPRVRCSCRLGLALRSRPPYYR